MVVPLKKKCFVLNVIVTLGYIFSENHRWKLWNLEVFENSLLKERFTSMK
jgi:hypothetical protein